MNAWSQDKMDERLDERERMAEQQLAGRGIRSKAVLAAMKRVPRELFVPAGNRSRAYEDGALTIDCGQTISQPYMVARMTELLGIEPGQSVLEIGTGSGYQTAILACIARHVYSIEWHKTLADTARQRLDALGLGNVTLRHGDGSLGWPEYGPFAAIIVTAGAPEIPRPLCVQLEVGGQLVVPIGPMGQQKLVLARRGDSGIEIQDILMCRFVKLLGEAGWKS